MPSSGCGMHSTHRSHQYSEIYFILIVRGCIYLFSRLPTEPLFDINQRGAIRILCSPDACEDCIHRQRLMAAEYKAAPCKATALVKYHSHRLKKSHYATNLSEIINKLVRLCSAAKAALIKREFGSVANLLPTLACFAITFIFLITSTAEDQLKNK